MVPAWVRAWVAARPDRQQFGQNDDNGQPPMGPRGPRDFASLDKNGDGVISPDEFAGAHAARSAGPANYNADERRGRTEMSTTLAMALAPARLADMMLLPARAGRQTTGGPRVESVATTRKPTTRWRCGWRGATNARLAKSCGDMAENCGRSHTGSPAAQPTRTISCRRRSLSFWRTAQKWQPGGAPLGAYLTRIAVNRAIDGDRKRQVRRFFGLEDVPEVDDGTTAADDTLAGRQTLKAVMEDLAGLPARQRAAILLSADGERSNAEIGETMGLSIGAVEQLLVRARRTLRAKLEARERQGGLGDDT